VWIWHYGLEPDVVAVGKGLGNGYPVSAVAMTDGFLAGWKPAAKVLCFYPLLTVAEKELARLVEAGEGLDHEGREQGEKRERIVLEK
jgi:acetylornithine/succinyldiaminopimelate/putrescine aminotransferase